ncbi:hypothetical protein BC834DRAFT_972983 [Gloeopeniophorella convolvens]|nr:hypothetical protein BC834DRAFT_972983 [Gloeopeniophorella convolvens]
MSHRSLSDGGSRPLPKTPASAPAFLQVPQNPAVVSLCEEHSPDLLSPAESTLSFLLPQRPADAGAIRRANLSKLRRHLGQSVPAALVAPDLEFDSDGEVSSSDDEVYADLPAARLTHASLSELTEAISPMLPALASDSLIRTYSRRWLREKKGQRWVEEDYDFILQSLRSLR